MKWVNSGRQLADVLTKAILRAGEVALDVMIKSTHAQSLTFLLPFTLGGWLKSHPKNFIFFTSYQLIAF